MRAALRLSKGQGHTFFGEQLDDEHFLLLAEQVPLLKSLHLIKCYYLYTNEGFANAIEKFDLLEELELSWCLDDAEVLELVAGACPGLKHLRLVNRWSFGPNDDRKAHAIARMRGLRSLHIVNDNLDNEGLVILDNCRHLEYLNICDCSNIKMDDNLRTKCARINMDDYEYLLPYDPNCCSSPSSLFSWDHDDYHDLSLSYFLGDDIDDVDEEDARIIDVKSMCRYLS